MPAAVVTGNKAVASHKARAGGTPPETNFDVREPSNLQRCPGPGPRSTQRLLPWLAVTVPGRSSLMRVFRRGKESSLECPSDVQEKQQLWNLKIHLVQAAL